MKFQLFFLISCISFFYSCQENEPVTLILPFEKNYGGLDKDYAKAATTLGDYIYILGTSKSLQSTTGGLYLLKIDSDGNQIFEKSYGGIIQEQGFNIINTRDGNLLLLGLTEQPTMGGTQVDIFLVKVTPNGDTLWTETYGTANQFDVAAGMAETDNGDVLLLGQTYNGVTSDMRVIRVDAQGVERWQKTYMSPYEDRGIDIAALGNDRYFLFGRRQNGDDDFCVITIDGQGNKMGETTYGTPQYEEGHRIYKTKDNNFVMCGHSSGLDPLHNLYAVKIDLDGNVLFEKDYGGVAHDGGTAVVELNNGDFLLVGETDSYENGSKRAFFVRTDKDGNTIEEGSYGGNLSDKFSTVISLKGAYYMIGESASVTTDGNTDVYVVKKVE